MLFFKSTLAKTMTVLLVSMAFKSYILKASSENMEEITQKPASPTITQQKGKRKLSELYAEDQQSQEANNSTLSLQLPIDQTSPLEKEKEQDCTPPPSKEARTEMMGFFSNELLERIFECDIGILPCVFF